MPVLARQFSSTSKNLRLHRQRAAMYAWLNGPGAPFRHPLPGSTNYLNAYDRSGRLLRVREENAPANVTQNQQSSGNPDGSMTLGAAGKNLEAAESKPLPREHGDDFLVFPLNRHFKSQSVLSEELRDEIWRRVKEEGKTVREVSVELDVEMRRVGAVIRLKAVEEGWRQQVSLDIFHLPLLLDTC